MRQGRRIHDQLEHIPGNQQTNLSHEQPNVLNHAFLRIPQGAQNAPLDQENLRAIRPTSLHWRKGHRRMDLGHYDQ